MKKVKGLFNKFIGVVIAVLGIVFLFMFGLESDMAIILGTIILTIGVAIYMTATPKDYNKNISSVKLIENPKKLSVKDVYNAFKNTNSLLGMPWLAEMKLIKGDVLILGPVEGHFIYMHKLGKNFCIASNFMTNFIKAKKEDEWRLENTTQPVDIFSDEDLVCYSLLAQSVLEDIYKIIEDFCVTGNAKPFFNQENLGKIYRFDEEFKMTGQKFNLLDFNNNPIYEMEATLPLKTFYMRNVSTGQEVFKMDKKLLKVLNKYEFFLYGEEYGVFEQKLDFAHDTFTMQTKDGFLEMQSINDKIGTNYLVKMDDRVIGTIAERFSITLHNLYFDNFILHVKDEKHTPLLGALTVMAARELQRDKTMV